jgi:hypothetical protein
MIQRPEHVANILSLVQTRLDTGMGHDTLYHSIGLLQGVAPHLATMEEHQGWIAHAVALFTLLFEELTTDAD